ncbi:UDP-glucose/GDP-mannose dehydrogenase family protein [bacterium]|nr:UDP-glucose/GDP-mannose dehydrogenase family protein [bacterium]
MRKNIAVIGAGYVGIAVGTGLLSLGHKVSFIDTSFQKIKSLQQGISPIYEPKVNEILQKYKGNYVATSSYEDVLRESEIVFICVGTPVNDKGKIDMSFILKASEEIGKAIKKIDNWILIVVKSTVLPGTTENYIAKSIEKYSGKVRYRDFGLAMNPEFLREGTALSDFLAPDRIVIGVNDEKSKQIMLELYEKIDAPKIITNIKTAEMIKYVSNAFLATKISFSNEIGNICKKLGIDAFKVFEAVGLDHRISPHFFRCGLGWGGSCFPKDITALINFAKEIGEELKILEAVVEVNNEQPKRMIALLKRHVPKLRGRRVGILGLSFKPGTDDIRESRALILVRELLKEGAEIIAYDPKAMENFKKEFPNIKYANSAQELIKSVDVVLIATEWEEFERLDYSGKIVIDGRRIKAAEKTAKIYEGMCW